MFQVKKIYFVILVLAKVSIGVQISHRIAGGYNARPGTIKSFVALEASFNGSTKLCGGFLGSPGDRVFTAANCVFE